jgi:hypothetical protein
LFRSALTDLVGDHGKSLAALVDGHGKSLAAFVGDRGKNLSALADEHGKSVTAFVGHHTKAVAYVGAAVALTGIGTATATAATASPGTATSIVSATRNPNVADAAGVQHGEVIAVRHPAATHSASKSSASKSSASKAASKKAGGKSSAKPASHAQHHAQAVATTREAAATKSRVHVVKHHVASWKQIRDAVAADTMPKPAPGKLPLADRLMPGSTSGPQAYLPLTASRMANATTIVRRALDMHMGLRSAVIAIATAEQESTLENIDYGDRDSLGLFQQRPSAGWGSPAQITDPSYAADAFLHALHAHQAADPSWAGQPLWENAQAVQDSAFPYAYAKWEAQAAQIVAQVTRQIS